MNRIHNNGPISNRDLESLAYIKEFYPDTLAKHEHELMYLMGLFYKTSEPKNMIEEVYSIFAKSIVKDTGEKFSPVQADAYQRIKNTRYFSFSAPTSIGKSFLFRELIKKFDLDIAIIVPSRALIAEYLNLVYNIVNKDVLVLQFVENVNVYNTSKRVFILTPERASELFKFTTYFKISLFLLDEAQISDSDRGLIFDSFVRRATKEFPEAKFIFAHPFVKNPEAQIIKHNFQGTDNSQAINYKQNTVGKIFIAENKGNYYYFSPYNRLNSESIRCEEDVIEKVLKKSGSLLIYTSKSKLYEHTYFEKYKKYRYYFPRHRDPEALLYVEKLREYIGASSFGEKRKSNLIRFMKYGIVIHHGSMPLKARLIIEDFVRSGFCRLCFATSTLEQGINMPFDMVIIDNFRELNQDLTFKNLIGRAGRLTDLPNDFNYGYVVVPKRNVATFSERINAPYYINETSELDNDFADIPTDKIDYVDAIKNDTFNDDYHLPETQIQRLNKQDTYIHIEYILDNLVKDGKPITGNDYYNLSDHSRGKIKDSFKEIYIIHLRRNELTTHEKSILSASIPILLWLIQGKTFKEITALRYYFLTNQKEQSNINRALKRGEITDEEASRLLQELPIRYSPQAQSLPNIQVRAVGLYPKNCPVKELDYDNLVYDTYDYIDKVIRLSLADPLCAAFELYFNQTEDIRAKSMSNYIRFGTDDPTEIWLLKYGFTFEDIEWLKEYIEYIDENHIVFNSIQQLASLTGECKLLSRYL